MMHRVAHFAVVGASILLASCAGAPQTQHSASATLRVLATTDIHAHILDYDYDRDRPDPEIGLNRVAALIAQARAEEPNTILFDNGDLLQGTPLGDLYGRGALRPGDIHPVYRAMNLMAYDAAVTGNHEYNYGLEALLAAVKGANFPTLAGNVLDEKTGRPILPASVLLERRIAVAGRTEPIEIGVIGVLTPQIMVWDRDKLTGRVRTVDQVQTVTRETAALRAQGADVVIVLAHGGLSSTPHTDGAENASAAIAALPGVDAVVTGHSHRVFPGDDYAEFPGADLAAGTVAGKPVVMAGAYGSHLGVIDLTLVRAADGWDVRGGTGQVRETTEALVPDPRIAAAVADAHAATLAEVRKPIGALTAPLQTYDALLGGTSAMSLIADAQSRYAKRKLSGTPWEGLPVLSAVAPFRAGGRPGPQNYTDVEPGPLLVRHAADLYPYPNLLVLVEVTGADVREWLEKSARLFNRIDPESPAPQPLIGDMPAYNFDVLFGLTYEVDVTQPARYGREPTPADPSARRIRDLRFEGRPVGDADRFIVVTNNYRANGGGGFPRLDGSTVVLVAPDPSREVLIADLKAQRTVTPAQQAVWRFAPMPGAPDVRILLGPDAARFALAGVTRIGPSRDGFDEYRVDFGALRAAR